jgi:hypothetical protein
VKHHQQVLMVQFPLPRKEKEKKKKTENKKEQDIRKSRR